MEAIGTLAGGIAHDFNNILFSIIGYTELAMGDSQRASQQHDNLTEVLIAAQRAGDLIQQILTFSLQTEKKLKPVMVKLIVKEVLKLLSATLPATIAIRQDLESNSLVMSDPTHIHQILMNLCTNAGYAMKEKGTVFNIYPPVIKGEANDKAQS